MLSFSGDPVFADYNNPDTDWMRDGKYGLHVKYLNWVPIGETTIEEFNQWVNAFDVNAFAEDVELTGASWVIWGLGRPWFNSPNATLESTVGDFTSDRDLPLEIYDALHERGIRLMLYAAADKARTAEDSAGKVALGWDGTNDNYTRTFVDNWADALQVWSDRYGTKVSGWWFDHSNPNYAVSDTACGTSNPELAIYRTHLLSGNPDDGIVGINHGHRMGGELCYSPEDDYRAGHIRSDSLEVASSRWWNGLQWHYMFPIGTSGWGSPYVRRDTQEQIDYVNENNRNEGVNTFSVFVYTMPGESAEGVVKVPGHLSNAQLRQLAALRDASLGFVDNTSSDISFNGTWAKQDDGMDFRGSTSWSAVADNHAEMAFTGTGVEVAARKGSSGGLVDVVLDGSVVVDDFDTYSSTTAYRQVIYENQNLSSGSRTIRLVATAQKNASATEANAMLDYFAVTRLDTKAPRVLSITSDATHPTKDPFTVTIDFLEDVTGLTAGEIVVNNGTGANLTGTGASYTLDIEPIANLEGEVTVRVPADAAEDEGNNGNLERSETFAVDAQAPAFQNAAVDGARLTLAYNEELDRFSVPTTNAFTVTGSAQAQTVSQVVVGGTVVELTLNPGVEQGEAGIRVSYTQGMNPIRDVPGNQAEGLSQVSVTNDNLSPLPLLPLYTVSSPDGSLTATVTATSGNLSYTVSRDGTTLIADSPLSIRDATAHTVTGNATTSRDSTWEPTWGQFSRIRDHHNRLTLNLDVGGLLFDLIFQVYDDGLGFRFVADEQASLTGKILSYKVRYNMDGNYWAYWPKGENSPEGPHPMDALPINPRRSVVVVYAAGNDEYFALLESDLFSADAFEAIKFWRVTGEAALKADHKSQTVSAGDFVSPWRVVLVGDTPGDLLESTVALNLAAPLALDDASWVKPGKGLSNWRTLGYQTDDDLFTYRLNTATLKRLIDFAADNGIEYVDVDDDWFTRINNGQLVSQTSDFDIEEVIAHADTKGVAITIYVDQRPASQITNTTDEQLYQLFSNLGGSAIKYGFRGNDAPFTRAALRGTAAKQMLINFHDDPTPMTGARRTMPNAITRQTGWSQQDNRRAFAPTDFLEMAMINALLGPFDQVNGIYDLNEMPDRDKGADNPINSTVAGENARVLIMFSGMIKLPDVPEEYAKKADMFEFLREMPVTWDETRILHSSLPNYITTARRSGEAWFVCSATNESAKTLSIDLDFLDAGVTYAVTYYEDDHDGTNPTHYIDNRETYQVRTGTVTNSDTVDAVMVAGGGHCMWIRTQPVRPPDTTVPPPRPTGGSGGGGGGGGGGGPRQTVPDAPTNLVAKGTDGAVALSWEAPEEDGGFAITNYQYRIDGKGGWISIGSTDTTHTVTGLVNGTEYTFQVRAVSRVGRSQASGPAKATPRAPVALDFAHFANGAGIISDLVFVNVAPYPIRPALAFYDPEGHLMDPEAVVDITGDLVVTEDSSLTVQTAMEPLGELTISTHGQGNLVDGSVRVVSDGPIGGVLRFDLPGIGVAGVGASLPLTEALFPVRREGELSTAAAIRNLRESELVVTCRLMKEGIVLEEVPIPLEANGQEAQYIEEMFTFTDTSDFVGSVRCTAPPGEGMFTGVAVELDAENHIFTTLPVVPVDLSVGGGRETVLDFAHFANGNGTTSDLVFVNRSSQPSRPALTHLHSDILPNLPTLYFYDQGGDLIDPGSVVDVTGDLVVTEDGGLTVQTEMEPLGVLTISTHGRGDLLSGSVKVTSDRPIGGVLRFDLPGIGVAGVGAGQAVRDALFPARRQAIGISTAAAIHNLGAEAMVVSCQLMQAGAVLEEVEIDLEANGQEALYIEQMFTRTDTSDFVGSVRCTAPAEGEGMFTGVAVELDESHQIFTTLPVTPVPERPSRE